MREITRDITVFVGMPLREQERVAVHDEITSACIRTPFTGVGAYDGVKEPYIAMDSTDFLSMLEVGRANPNFYQHLLTQECIGVVYIDDFGRVRMGTRPVPFVLRQIRPDHADKEVCSMPHYPESAYRHIKGWIEYDNRIFYPAGS